MTQLIEFPVASDAGHVVIVEVDEASGAGVERAGRRGEVAGQAAKSMTEAVEHVLPAAEVVLDKLRGLVSAPDEVTVTFGVKLSAKLGAFIASAQGEGNFQVQLKWAQTPKASTAQSGPGPTPAP